MERLVGGIAMHKPLVPPTVVLTLGNGFDFWAIRAAQEWPVCTQQCYFWESCFDPFPWQRCRVTAHSLLGVHKDGMNVLIRSMGLADRVTYVRGDPSSDPFISLFFHPVPTHCHRKELCLDYPNNTFDMVRLSYCSLNLAETEVSTSVRLKR
jgi:hypothetical protein